MFSMWTWVILNADDIGKVLLIEEKNLFGIEEGNESLNYINT